MKIAIVKGMEFSYDMDYNSYEKKIAESITDWAEVTLEEYQNLSYYLSCVSPKLNIIIERVDNARIPDLIKDCLTKAKSVAEERKKLQATYEKKKLEKSKKKSEKERQKFLALKKKYENQS